ncbi:sensor histidine kinase [Treponema brennaborense]|uniref:Signal transduction histidine kinase n=1 Tax=Treponema brennaborense (strain DSM 12168 / CIP 105900 / DD5/3) TaxID=906968 RepID=F4LPH4_TREBD|nr:histidine kinase [Treponema brennaborense]AEE15985.1 putative signal transduction histidine kinase [Treponema brennaborense DSM 12168]
MKTSIRSRLLRSFFLSFCIMCVLILYVAVIVSAVVRSVAVSYKTNSELDAYYALLAQTELSLESYMKLRTYESIDNYYSFRSKLESHPAILCGKPSVELIGQKEYSILRFTESFIGYADKAVYARRANKNREADGNYIHAMKSFSLLTEAVSELSTLYFRNNITRYNQLLETVSDIMKNCASIILLIIVLNTVLIYMLVSRITQPLVEISDAAHQLAERNFDIPLFSYDKQDEIGNICRAFNRMIVSIREYIDTIWEKAINEAELRERESKMTALYQDAQLKALQAQINPHFLFNTFNTGAQLAMLEGSDRTCRFLEQASDFYRYNLSRTGQDTTLQEELALVDNYVYIMKVRFTSKFDFEKEIECADLRRRIPSMTLQPLVENCIRHGLADVSSGGKITLRVYSLTEGETETVCVTIADNGCGFPPQERQRLLSGNPGPVQKRPQDGTGGTGIGLDNVVTRLRTYYQTDDVFDIAEAAGGGTVFIIRIRNV